MGILDNPEMDYDDIMKEKAKQHESKDFHLCFLRDKPTNLELQEIRGYVPVTESSSDKAGGVAARRLVKVGDTVLARLPNVVYKARQNALKEKNRRQMASVRESARLAINKAAGKHADGDMSTGDVRTEVTKR